jgi:hypothetical protein
MKILFGLFKGFNGAIFGFGAFLVIFGIASSIPGVGVIDERYRVLAISSGFIIAIISILLQILHGDNKKTKIIENEGYLDDDELSTTQKLIIDIIQKDYVEFGLISQDDVETKCAKEIKKYNEEIRKMAASSERFFHKKEIEPVEEAEMYYRLEHLLFKGYITKIRAGRSKDNGRFRFTYYLSDEYRARKHIAKSDPKATVE